MAILHFYIYHALDRFKRYRY